MRQRFLFMSCLLFALVLITFTMNAQEKAPVWDFPVRPGTEEWKKFTSIEEQYAAYNIPTDLLQRISTAELVQTCLKYPEWGLMYAFQLDKTLLYSIINKSINVKK